jgi:hypothetical protein
MSDKKHEHRHRKPHVDLEEHYVYLGSKIYQWEDRKGDWVGGAGGHFVRERDWVRYRKKDDATGRVLNDSKSEDRHLIRKLDGLVEHKKHRQERQQKLIQKVVLAAEEDHFRKPSDSAAASESAAEKSADGRQITPWQKHEQRPKKGSVIERDKYGVRLYSSDPRFYLDVCVNTSKKYTGTSVRVSCPPSKKNSWRTFTFDLETMEALRREVDRGEQSEKKKRP